ncbi:hypothetical protein IWW39_003453 [Coemansia spiralis]|uniref:Uncharacterized protein n=1 Tax=Coemansia spiralis TaxID=417178 RepID=A0A9W8GLH3_9FUNG|nr:hypothetical protein IWW39_003453 [Coemansia spiralis]
MDSRSPFQTLPMLIVYKVVEYLEGCPRKLHGSTSDEFKKKSDTLAPLLMVSERWCAAALASICSVCTLSFSHSREAIEVRFPGWPSSIPHAPFRKTHLAKKVIALADVWQNLCDGKFCEVITLPQYETLSFPSAKFLEFRLSKAVKEEVAVAHNSQSPSAPTPEIGREQVASVARALLRLVPTVIDMDMTVCTIGDTEPNYIQLYEWLVTELCRGRVDRLQIWSWTRGVVLPLRLDDISGLTSITRGKNVSNSAFSRLAYLSAGTLKTLEILLTEVDWLDLIFGDTDDPVVYANLVSLKLEIGEIPYGTTWAAIEAVEPFPVLATLEIYGGYPFADDLLFRGNGGTLQNLCLPFSALCRNALGRFNVLRRSAVTRMNSICIDEAVDADQAFLIENADFAFEQQVHHILEVAYSLVLPNNPEEYRLYHSLLSAPKAAILQRLDFGDLVFSASGLFEVVAALPSLSSLTCAISGFGQGIEAIPPKERPISLHTKYYPLSQNFRTLIPVYYRDSSAKEMAHVAMLLAVVCPSLRAVIVPPMQRSEYSREIAWSMLNATFKPYADRLNGLIYWD